MTSRTKNNNFRAKVIPSNSDKSMFEIIIRWFENNHIFLHANRHKDLFSYLIFVKNNNTSVS